MEKYFTSDIHFGHFNIIKYCERPFQTVEEMDEAIISNWNEKVGKKDEVYFLGDFSFHKKPEKDTEILSRLNGRKFLIRGNHDNTFKLKKVVGWEWIKEIYEIVLDKKVVLFHYPIDSWNGAFHGSFHFHGHKHSSTPLTAKNRYDVGVDAWNYYPVTYEEIIKWSPKF